MITSCSGMKCLAESLNFTTEKLKSFFAFFSYEGEPSCIATFVT